MGLCKLFRRRAGSLFASLTRTSKTSDDDDAIIAFVAIAAAVAAAAHTRGAAVASALAVVAAAARASTSRCMRPRVRPTSCVVLRDVSTHSQRCSVVDEWRSDHLLCHVLVGLP